MVPWASIFFCVHYLYMYMYIFRKLKIWLFIFKNRLKTFLKKCFDFLVAFKDDNQTGSWKSKKRESCSQKVPRPGTRPWPNTGYLWFSQRLTAFILEVTFKLLLQFKGDSSKKQNGIAFLCLLLIEESFCEP